MGEMSKNKDDPKAEAMPVKKDYKFEIALFKSRQYVLPKEESSCSSTTNKATSVNDEAADADNKAHMNATNKVPVYIVRCNRIMGDELQFNKLLTKIYNEGAQIFNNLPDWAVKAEKQDTVFDGLLADFDKEVKDVNEEILADYDWTEVEDENEQV